MTLTAVAVLGLPVVVPVGSHGVSRWSAAGAHSVAVMVSRRLLRDPGRKFEVNAFTW